LLEAQEWSVVIAKSCSIDHKTLSITNVYLKKQRFLGDCKLKPLNLSSKHPTRAYFTKEVLNISHKSWTRYYNKMHFKGVKAPHVVSSPQSMLKYLENIHGAIGYLPSSSLNETSLKKFSIILKFHHD